MKVGDLYTDTVLNAKCVISRIETEFNETFVYVKYPESGDSLHESLFEKEYFQKKFKPLIDVGFTFNIYNTDYVITGTSFLGNSDKWTLQKVGNSIEKFSCEKWWLEKYLKESWGKVANVPDKPTYRCLNPPPVDTPA